MEKMGKTDSNSQHVEGAPPSPSAMESGKTEAFYVEDRVAHLSEEHRQYLLARHGTLDLDPIPDMNDADPYNWPRWRVRILSAVSRGMRADQRIEKPQPGSRRVPRHDRSVYRFVDSIRLYQHLRRSGCQHAAY